MELLTLVTGATEWNNTRKIFPLEPRSGTASTPAPTGQNAGKPGQETARDKANPNSVCRTQPDGVEPVQLARETGDDHLGARGKTTQECKQTEHCSALHCAQTWHGCVDHVTQGAAEREPGSTKDNVFQTDFFLKR